MRLERQLTVRHAVGTSAERRHNARVAAQVTLWRLFVVFLSVPLVIFVVDKATWNHFPTSDVDESSFLVQRYAYEAFPQWASANQWAACPQTIDELAPFTYNRAPVDAWGTKLEMRCSTGTRIYVRSAGPDLRFDTADDITSNDQ